MKKYLGYVVFLALFYIDPAFATNYFAVGTGNWSGAATVWATTSGGTPGTVTPTSADTCTFDANTLVHTITVAGTSGSPDICGNVVMSSPSGTLIIASGKELDVYGSWTGASGMTFAPNAASLLKFKSTSAGQTITFGGYAYGPLTFDGVGGGWQFQDTNSMAASTLITLTNGSLDTNSQTQTNSIKFSSNNSNTRSLTLGTTNFKLASNGATPWDIGTSTGMTLSAASSTITASTAANNDIFAGGGLTYGTLTSSAITTGSLSFTGANTFGTLTTSVAGTTKTVLSGYAFPAGITTIVTGTFTAAGNTLLLRDFLYSSTIGTAATISAGTFVITNTDLRDITKAGAGSGNISTTSATTGNGDCGGNTGWTFQSPRNVFMKTAVSVNWSAGNWFTTSGGSTAATPPLPLCHDTNAVFDVNSVTAGSKTITVDQPRISGFTFSGVANTPAFALGSNEFEVYGSFVLVSGMTNTGTASIDLMGRGSFSLDGGGLTFPATIFLGNANFSQVTPGIGTYTLAQNLTSNATLRTHQNILALGGHNLSTTNLLVHGAGISGTGTLATSGGYTQDNGTVTLGGTMTITGANTFSLSGGTLDMNSNQITGHTTATISSTGTLNLSGQLNGSGAVSVTGGTITDAGASGELKGTTMSFSGGTSAIRKMTASSTFAISSTAALTFNPGTSTWVTSYTETGTTHSLTYNGTATNINGTLTVTAAAAGDTTGYAWSQ